MTRITSAAVPQLALDLGHRPALGGDDFLVAPCNRAAVAWLDLWPDWPGPALAVHGPPGCGKTHLAHVWRARSGAIPVAPAALADPPALAAAARAFVLDGVDPDRTPLDEAGLLHFYNLVAERGGHLLICARVAPARWPVALADLRSRLAAAPAVAVAAPDDALIEAVLVKLFADRQLAIGADALRYLATHMERSFEAARNAVAAIDRAALAARRRVTVALIRDVLAGSEKGEKGDSPL